MRNVIRIAMLVVVAAFAAASAMYEPSMIGSADPAQKPTARSRPSTAPPTGHAVPRRPPDAQHPTPAPSPTPHAVPRTTPPPHVPPVDHGPVVVGPRVHVPPPWGWYEWPYPYGYPAPPYALMVPSEATGSVRLDVTPTDAHVYVDGYFAGVVSDFNGVFDHLTLPAGPHYLEIRKLGMVPLAVEIYVVVNHTTTYRATMQPADGEAGDARDDTE